MLLVLLPWLLERADREEIFVMPEPAVAEEAGEDWGTKIPIQLLRVILIPL